MGDLKREKSRVEMELSKTEDHIRYNFRELREILTFRYMAARLLEEMERASAVVSAAVDTWKKISEIFKRRRNRNNKGKEEEGAGSVS